MAEQLPNAERALLLVTARRCRIHEGWQERRYLDMSALDEIHDTDAPQANAA